MTYQYSIPDGRTVDFNRVIKEVNELKKSDFILLTCLNRGRKHDVLLLVRVELLKRFQHSDAIKLSGEIICSEWGYEGVFTATYEQGLMFLPELENRLEGYRATILSSSGSVVKALGKEIEFIRSFRRKVLIKVHTL